MIENNLFELAEGTRQAALQNVNANTQSSLGQFFTPVAAAKFIVSMVGLPSEGTVRVLDPGAGSGMLSAALIARILLERPELNVEVVAVERDQAMMPYLESTLSACKAAAPDRVFVHMINADFILDSAGSASKLDFESQFDIVIENPPYGKLSASSEHRKTMQARGIDTPNLYAAFLSISMAALKPGGQLVAITPRSFFNGPYFGPFRKHLLNMLALDSIHVFDSRSAVFADTGVLQENVVFAGTRDGNRGEVTLSISRDHLDKCAIRTVPYSEVVYPGDPHLFIRLATTEEDTSVAEVMLSQPCVLADLGIQVSTGKVVDFRSRGALRNNEEKGATPIIYPANLHAGEVQWPLSIRKPQWFMPKEQKDVAMLLPQGWYTVVKRFSSKEERRRIVSATWSPAKYSGMVAFENHLNVFHAAGQGLDEELAKGLSIWLNSSVVEKFFRMFSGHTQVNATDLRTLRFPTAESLRRLGSRLSGVDLDLDAAIWEQLTA